jgi:hypothetical protein
MTESSWLSLLVFPAESLPLADQGCDGYLLKIEFRPNELGLAAISALD